MLLLFGDPRRRLTLPALATRSAVGCGRALPRRRDL